MSIPNFKQRLNLLLVLLWIQRALRLSLRIIWTAMAGYLLGWGINSLWGWLPDSRTWMVLGLLFASFSLIGIFFPVPRLSRMTWKLDRRLNLQEQVTTAWQVFQKKDNRQVPNLLIYETMQLFPDIMKRVAGRGWFLGRDLLSMLIVLILFWLVFWGDLDVVPIELPETQVDLLPVLGEDPSAEDVFPSGIPGLKPPESASTDFPGHPTAGIDEENQVLGGADFSSDMSKIEESLKRLGTRLSQQAISYDVGQALKKGELDQAANEIERLADQVDQLSDDAKKELSNAMKTTSYEIRELSTNQQEPLSRDLGAASAALDEGSDSEAKKELDQFANSLRDLSAAQASQESGNSLTEGTDQAGLEKGIGPGGGEGGTGASSRERGESQVMERLSGEGETLELGQVSDQEGLLRPAVDLSDRGTDIARGSLSSNIPGDSEVVDSLLAPYYFSWKWRNVVSTYFSPH